MDLRKSGTFRTITGDRCSLLPEDGNETPEEDTDRYVRLEDVLDIIRLHLPASNVRDFIETDLNDLEFEGMP